MTILNLVEMVEDIFGQGKRTFILKQIDSAQKEFCRSSKILTDRAELTDITNNVAWVLPADFLKLTELEVYDSNGYPLSLFNQGLKYEIEFGALYFISLASTPLVSIPTAIDSMFIKYIKLPTTITDLTDSLDIPEDYHLAMEAFLLERMYARYPVDIVSNGQIVKGIDRQMVRYYNEKYKEYIREARKNRFNDESITEPIQYPGAGKYELPKRNKYESAGSITSLDGASLLYSKYLSFTATSPNTIEVKTSFGYTDVDIVVTDGVIVITSTEEFSLETEYADNQYSNHSQISTSRIEVYPATNWGVLSGRVYVTL